MSAPNWSVTPIRPDLGARVRGLRIGGDLGAEGLAALEQALYAHGMLVIEGQHDLPAPELEAFARLFCEPREPVESLFRVPEAPTIAILGNVTKADGQPLGFQNRFGIEWHVDGTGWQRTAATTFLYCLETPAASGDTLYVSGASALAALPPALRARAEAVRAIYNRQQLINKLRKASDNSDKEMTDEEAKRFPDVIRPLVRRHPVTGQAALNFTIEECRQVEGMDPAASRAFLEELLSYATAPDLVYSHRWQRGEVVMWDNRLVLHSTTPYTYEAEKRLHWRLIGYEHQGDLAPLAAQAAG